MASKKYDVPRTTISYWIKKLKEKIEELEFVKDFQQDIIADMELITGIDMAKKSLPKTLAKEINRLKENGSMGVLGLVNKLFYKRCNTQENKKINHQKLTIMVKDYRKKVSSQNGGIKLYHNLKTEMINQNINIGSDKFYDFLRLNNLLIKKRKNYVTTTNSKHLFRKYKNLVKDHVPFDLNSSV